MASFEKRKCYRRHGFVSCSALYCYLELVTFLGTLRVLPASSERVESIIPVLSVEPQFVIVKPGSKLELSCQFKPKPLDVVRWRIDEKYLEASASDGVSLRGARLLIEPASTAHAGSYDCVLVRNDSSAMLTVLSSSADVKISYMRNFANSLSDTSLNFTEGNVAVIPCSPPESVPPANVTFELNGVPVDMPSGRHFMLPSGNLQIANFRPGDQGQYRCAATNPVSGHRKTAPNTHNVHILPPISKAAEIVHYPKDRSEVVRGSTLSLECVVDGSPVPVVTWEKYGGVLHEGRFQQILGNLHIRDVKIFDQGTYICRAHNNIGQPQAAISMVDITERPTVHVTPAHETATVGSTVVFECNWYGKPRATSKWLNNGRPIDEMNNAHFSVADTTLTIKNVLLEHAGVYQCMSRNKLGSAVASALLDVYRAGEKNSTSEARLAPSGQSSDEAQSGKKKKVPTATLR